MPAEVVRLAVPPHSVEAEQAVLGALLLDSRRCWPLLADKLSSASFYRPDHRLIFGAIREAMRGGTADLVTVDAVLAARKEREAAGGFQYLGVLARDTPGTANIEHHAAIVRERAVRRALVELARTLEADALEWRGTDAEGLAARTARDLAQLQSAAQEGAGLVSSRDLAGALIDDLDKRREGQLGLMTGLADLDEILGGLEAGELTIFAARPGLGKTALLVTIAAHVAREFPVAVFSAEMPALQLARRCAALLGGISQDKLRHPKRMTDTDWATVSEAVTKFSERRLWIDDRQLPPLEHIRAECIGRKARDGLSLVMIDYVQLVSAPGRNRYEQLRDVAYGAKALAKELTVPVIVLAQLNRGVEARQEKRAQLSDLRDSGAIEEAADVIGLLYREDYYDPTFGMPNIVECAIEKHRNGERGQCLWHFAGEYSRMTALDIGARAQYRHLMAARKKGANDG